MSEIKILTMKHYSAMRKKEILSLQTTWMKVEDIIVSAISQTRKTHIAWHQLHMEAKKDRLQQPGWILSQCEVNRLCSF